MALHFASIYIDRAQHSVTNSVNGRTTRKQTGSTAGKKNRINRMRVVEGCECKTVEEVEDCRHVSDEIKATIVDHVLNHDLMDDEGGKGTA